MERKYRKKSNLVNSTGYTPGYASEKNAMNIIPSNNITMENTPYPVYGQPLDQFGNPIANPTYMEPGQNYDYGDDTSYVAEVPAYKDGGKKQAWISNKIGVLMGEGRPQKQAIAIAYSMWNQKHEDGGYQMPEYQNAGTINFGQAPNAFSLYNRTPDFNKSLNLDTKIDSKDYGFGTESQLSNNSLTAGEDWKKNNPLPQGVFASNLSDDATNTTATTTNAVGTNNGIHQFYNPYGDVGMGDALYFGGQEFAKGNNLKGAAGLGLGLLKGTKDFLAGMGNQKRQDTIMKSYNENQRKNMTGENRALAMKMGGYYQDGGQDLTKAYIESGQYPDDAQNWYDNNPPMFSLPAEESPVVSETPMSAEPTQKEVWQVWEEKTGKPWSEAKKLGYTDGTSKDNLKLLSELNDPRFKASNLRGSALKTTTKKKQEVDNKVKKEIEKAKKTLSYSEYMKKLPKANRAQGEIKTADEYNVISRTGEILANPFQSIGEYAKYGELPASGFSKNDKNAYDQVLGMINPAYWANAAGNAVDFGSEGEYARAGREALDVLPALRTVKLAKFLPVGRVASVGSEVATVGNRAASVAAPRMTTAVGQARRAAPLRNYFEQALPAGRGANQLGQGALRLPQGAPRLGQGPQQYGQLSFGFKQGGYYEEGGDQMGGEMPMPQEESAGQEAQVMQQVAQMLQQGANPQEVLQQLVQSGIPEDQATQMVQMVMQGSQATPQLRKGGEMIKRADGSYSKRGLWDNIRDNAGSGKKPTKEMLEQEAKIKANKKEMGGYMYAEGGINNPGFKALPEDVQAKILASMQEGGTQEAVSMEDVMSQVGDMLSQGADPQEVLQMLIESGIPEDQAIQIIEAAIQQSEQTPQMRDGGIPQRYKSMGFNKVGAKKQSSRPGKKWMVLAKKGDQYKVVHGGDDKMKDFSQHGSEDRKENFWNRMGGRDSAKANDPFSPLYWHKKFGTWQEGGEIEEPEENEQVEGENPQQEQIEDQVEQALKQGADPQEILQQLVQMGMPEQEAIQMIQEILQELQNGEEQEAPEEGQPMMKDGGSYLEAMKGKTIKNYTYNKNTGNYDVEFE